MRGLNQRGWVLVDLMAAGAVGAGLLLAATLLMQGTLEASRRAREHQRAQAAKGLAAYHLSHHGPAGWLRSMRAAQGPVR